MIPPLQLDFPRKFHMQGNFEHGFGFKAKRKVNRLRASYTAVNLVVNIKQDLKAPRQEMYRKMCAFIRTL